MMSESEKSQHPRKKPFEFEFEFEFGEKKVCVLIGFVVEEDSIYKGMDFRLCFGFEFV